LKFLLVPVARAGHAGTQKQLQPAGDPRQRRPTLAATRAGGA